MTVRGGAGGAGARAGRRPALPATPDGRRARSGPPQLWGSASRDAAGRRVAQRVHGNRRSSTDSAPAQRAEATTPSSFRVVARLPSLRARRGSSRSPARACAQHVARAESNASTEWLGREQRAPPPRKRQAARGVNLATGVESGQLMGKASRSSTAAGALTQQLGSGRMRQQPRGPPRPARARFLQLSALSWVAARDLSSPRRRRPRLVRGPTSRLRCVRREPTFFSRRASTRASPRCVRCAAPRLRRVRGNALRAAARRWPEQRRARGHSLLLAGAPRRAARTLRRGARALAAARPRARARTRSALFHSSVLGG